MAIDHGICWDAVVLLLESQQDWVRKKTTRSERKDQNDEKQEEEQLATCTADSDYFLDRNNLAESQLTAGSAALLDALAPS